MSKQANPVAIGAFVLGAILLTVATVIYVGSIKLFSANPEFILYFDESVNGLEVGAPVKFKGVRVGKVQQILIRSKYQPESSDHVPVIIEIDSKRVTNLGVQEIGFLEREEELVDLINAGLRARLELDSIITGLLFIELDFPPDPSPPEIVQTEAVIREIPTVPSAFAEIGQSANDIIAKISALDVRALNDGLLELMGQLNLALEEIDVRGLSDSLIGMSDAIKDRVDSEEVTRLIENLDAAVGETRALVASLDNEVGPVSTQLQETLASAESTISSAQMAVADVRQILSPESPLLYKLNDTMKDISAAARAMRQLAEFLERNPKALLAGRKPAEE